MADEAEWEDIPLEEDVREAGRDTAGKDKANNTRRSPRITRLLNGLQMKGRDSNSGEIGLR